jgi:hypothetical protein
MLNQLFCKYFLGGFFIFLFILYSALLHLPRMRSSLARMRSSLVRMRSSLVVRVSDCQCARCNGPGFDPSIRRHSCILLFKSPSPLLPSSHNLCIVFGLLQIIFEDRCYHPLMNTIARRTMGLFIDSRGPSVRILA